VPPNLCIEEDAVLNNFIARYHSAITAMLSGFDRLVFRGALLPQVMERGMPRRPAVDLVSIQRFRSGSTAGSGLPGNSKAKAVTSPVTTTASPAWAPRAGAAPDGAAAYCLVKAAARCAGANPQSVLNPLHRQIFKSWPLTYYWSAYQSEWATDLLFCDRAALAAIYPALVRHAMLHFTVST